MFEKLKGISLEGEMLEGKTKFDIFDSNSKLSVIYGRNGSGKSTVAKGFKKIKGDDIPTLTSAELYETNDSHISSSDEIKDNVFVFDEGFIEKNIKIDSDGLNSIVMFGEQVELEELINTKSALLTKKREEYSKKQDNCRIYEDAKNINSPSFHWNKTKSLLSGEGKWSSIDKQIKGNRNNSSVTDQTVEMIVKTKPEKSEDELKNDFRVKMEELKHFSDSGAKIERPIILEFEYKFNKEEVDALLKEKIEEPVLSSREKQILHLIQHGNLNVNGIDYFLGVKEYFEDDKTDQCPYCLQETSKDYKASLIKNIEAVLNKDVEEHISKLSDIKISNIDFPFDLYKELDQTLVLKVKNNVDDLNEVLNQYVQYIDQKSSNVYQPIDTKVDIALLVKDFSSNLENLEIDRVKYNNKFASINKTKDELHIINKELAYYMIIDTYNLYLTQKDLKQKEFNKLSLLKKEGIELAKEVNQLLQRQSNTHIAVDFINKGLKYIFFSKERLHIHPKENKYLLYSNGKSVQPINISCGERNALGLCYFFTLMLNNKNEVDVYKNESLLIIDDPVSSFDLENQVGILSYLKSQILKVVSGNINSKIAIFSHDLMTIDNIKKIMEEVEKNVVKTQFELTNNKIKYHISHKKIEKFTVANIGNTTNDYNRLLVNIFDYAVYNEKDSLGSLIIPNDDLVIGNTMRRVLEAFSTFEYRMGINEISTDRKILYLMDEEYADYFENLMYRLVLNGESHLKDRVKDTAKIDFYTTISLEEKQRTARDVLCLMFVLNQTHIKYHFKDNQKAIEKIEQWCREIKSK
ncbi:AAA family ATPase [Erysipelothrix sp. HDW6A]|uniref:AAA family ATPase n=1 Tax=Erysipelothrix sp. HDW6A TaxID=2714928 RepID=UPI0014073A51|nr:AAA family ATPase [Erysipelothrix sp. HDW6A]QIK56816.1 AAA family ATPase [Erysipelothrix sp. HDW6A]